MNMKKLTLISAAILTAAFTASSQAQTTTVVADDDYATNGTANPQVSFFGSSGTNAIETNTNSIGLVSGHAGRTIHGLFPSQTLETIGDQVIVSATFLTPDTVGLASEEFRMGLFSSLDRAALAQTTSFADPNYNDIPGFYVTIDIEEDGLDGTSGTDLDIRTNEIDSLDQTGTFLSTSGNFDTIGSSSGDANYAISANTSYTINLTVERVADSDGDGVDNTSITAVLFEGTTQLSDITRVDGGSELLIGGLNRPIGSFGFDMFAAQAGSNAAGEQTSTNADGGPVTDPDLPNNGIDFTAISVSFFDADGVDGGGPAAPADGCTVVPTEGGEFFLICP